jgi:hypothetical protein
MDKPIPRPELQQFVSEAITPEFGSFDASAMARGEPGVPRVFAWRGTQYVVARVLSTWKTSSTDRGDLYLRRHWYAVQTAGGQEMTLYCERQTKNHKRPKARWWLYSVGASGGRA